MLQAHCTATQSDTALHIGTDRRPPLRSATLHRWQRQLRRLPFRTPRLLHPSQDCLHGSSSAFQPSQVRNTDPSAVTSVQASFLLRCSTRGHLAICRRRMHLLRLRRWPPSAALSGPALDNPPPASAHAPARSPAPMSLKFQILMPI